MSHEIMEHDNVVLHREGAWHGLGIVVENAPTPSEALKIAGLDWPVEQWSLSASNGEGRKTAITNRLANVRADTGHCLGIVGPQYQPVQNKELADFCELLAKEGDQVKIESAGSIRNGQRVWFLLKGESFSVRGDENKPYILASNGHDGITSLRCTPTTIRVVCSNTLHMVIPEPRSGEGSLARCKIAGYCGNHVGDVKAKVEAARQALQLYSTTLATNKELITGLAARDMNNDAVNRFLLETYARSFGAVAVNPKTDKDVKHREKALTAVAAMLARFDLESKAGGANAWTAVNAFTGYLQHQINPKETLSGRDRRLASQLFGLNAERGAIALSVALSL